MNQEQTTNDPRSLTEEPSDWLDWINQQQHLPPAIIKACMDTFSYAVGLRGGMVIQFSTAGYRGGQFVTLYDVENVSPHPGGADGKFNFERGIEVRIDEIVWAADAPYGS